MSLGSFIGGVANFGQKALNQALGNDPDWIPGVSVKGGARTTSGSPVGKTLNKGMYPEYKPDNKGYPAQQSNPAPAYNGASGGRGGGRGGGGGGGGGGSSAAAQQAAAQNAQLSQIDRLLGILGSQESQGMSAIESGYGSQKQRLTDQQTKAMAGYQDQFLKNDQNKQKGVEQVDDFANTSYNSLQSLLRGANAGVSSVGRQLVPHVVAKGAGTRRKDVFDTAGENTKQITSAKGDAEDQFRLGFEDLGNQRNDQIKNLRQGINQQAMDLEAQKMMLQAQAGNATDATARSLDARAGTLQSLFGQYAPSYTAKAMNLKTPELGQYQLDPGAIRQDQGLPAETRAYLPGIDRRREREERLR